MVPDFGCEHQKNPQFKPVSALSCAGFIPAKKPVNPTAAASISSLPLP
jgi:hypothetical protein